MLDVMSIYLKNVTIAPGLPYCILGSCGHFERVSLHEIPTIYPWAL